MKRFFLLGFGAFLAGLCLTIGVQPSDANSIIRVKGSDEMAGRVDYQAKMFVKNHPDVTVTVSGGSTGTGLPDLLEGNCEVVMSGHELAGEEEQRVKAKGIHLVKRLVGYGGIAILTYPENPVSELTVDQVQKLMTGDYTSWSQVGGPDVPVVVVSLEAVASDTRLFLLQDFLRVPSVKSQVVRVLSFRSIINKVIETKGAVGYCRMRDLEGSEEAQRVRVLKIKKDPASPGILPSRPAIVDQSYPIRRPFSLWLNAKAGEDVKTFVDFVVSKGWGAPLK